MKGGWDEDKARRLALAEEALSPDAAERMRDGKVLDLGPVTVSGTPTGLAAGPVRLALPDGWTLERLEREAETFYGELEAWAARGEVFVLPTGVLEWVG